MWEVISQTDDKKKKNVGRSPSDRVKKAKNALKASPHTENEEEEGR
jgi:hypothetical protein